MNLQADINNALANLLDQNNWDKLPEALRINAIPLLQEKPNLLFTIQGKTIQTNPWVRVYDEKTHKAYLGYVRRSDPKSVGVLGEVT